MQTKEHTEFVPCIPGALSGGLSRTRFFDGMFLKQKDLEREQFYWKMKRRLTNRALGQGVVWGLRLEWDPLHRRFRLGPGYALDCCGNDLIVECPAEIMERTLIDKSDPTVKALLAGEMTPFSRCPGLDVVNRPRKACVVLQYVECPEDPQPVHQNACTTDLTRCEYSSVRETTRVLLVPPPHEEKSNPIDKFCENLQDLITECESDMKCELFQKGTKPKEGKLHAFIRVKRESRPGNGLSLPAWVTLHPYGSKTQKPENVGIVIDPPDIPHLWLEPEPGYVFLGGIVKTSSNAPISVAPFGVEIGEGGNPAIYEISELVVAPLFGNGVGQEVDLNLTQSVKKETYGVVHSIGVITNRGEEITESASCIDFFSEKLVFNTDPTCATKTLLLSLLCGWFKGMIGPTNQRLALPGRSEVAWWICFLSWRLLFKANLEEDTEGKLSNLLEKLFKEWCAGFVYPGPRCVDAHHGVYLGCVEISPKGNIISFDPWEHRRHVVTGALLSHWGGQLGFAPIDVVASRFVRWICCLSSQENLRRPEQLIKGQEEVYIPGMKGMGLYYGANLIQLLNKQGWRQVGNTQSLSLKEFGSQVFPSFFDTASAGETDFPLGRKVYQVEGLRDVYLLMPTQPSVSVRPHGEFDVLRGIISHQTETEGMRPLAVPPVRDLVIGLAESVPLRNLLVPEGNTRFPVFVEALEVAEVGSVATFLEVGPEAGVERVRAQLMESELFVEEEDILKTAEEVFLAAKDFVVKSTETLKAAVAATSGTFSRNKLGDSKIIEAVKKATSKTLKNKLTNEAIKNVAEKVSRMRS